MMNIQESVPVNTPPPTQNSTCSNPVQRIMPLLYVGQSNPTPASSTVPVTTGPTIISAIPQIQLSGGGNPQIIHSSPNPSTYSYVPVSQVYNQAKPTKGAEKRVCTLINKPSQVKLIFPNSGNKSPITSLILPHVSTMSNKGTISGMLVPNSSTTGTNNNKPITSLLLPSNAKYPNIAPHKKVPIPNIIVPQQNMTNKPTNVPNIIRQTNNPSGKNVVGILSSSSTQANTQMTSLLLAPNTNNNNKQPPTSTGLILPTTGPSHGIIMPPSTSPQTHSILMSQSTNGQSHSIIVPPNAAGQSHSIIMPQSSGCQSQVTNLIITSTTSSIPHSTTTPVGSLLISNNSSNSGDQTHMTSLLMSQNNSGSNSTTSANSQKTARLIVPMSAVGASKTPVTFSNGMKNVDAISITARENKQSVLMKPNMESSYPGLPPLQPITKDNGGKSVLTKTPNGLIVPESLTMTPITDSDPVKMKPEKISDDMIIERTSVVTTDEKGTSTSLILRCDEKMPSRIDEECIRTDVGVTASPITSLRGSEHDEGLLLDGEVTVRRLGPDKEVVPEKKPLDDDVKIELVKPERQKLPPPRYQKPEDLNPMEVLEWDHQGVGKLPGSNIKFRINEFGLDLVVDNNKAETPSSTPQSSRRNSDEKPPHETKSSNDIFGEGMDKIYCCEGCGCYGLYTEFLMDTRFCSVGCKKIVLARNELKKKRQEDKLKEIRLRRKRRKIKLISQRAKRGSVDQKTGKELVPNKGEQLDDANQLSKVWTNKMVELRKSKKAPEGNININMRLPDTDSDSNQSANSSNSDSSDSMMRQDSEDESMSEKTAANSDSGKETSWINSSGEFLWPVYLQKCCNKAKAAPFRLFKDPLFPYGKNGFKVGMKLEGIDPEHQAIISVLTVAQVKGHRVRLHFDGYPDHHDFWVNSDSPDIFPPGWCEKNNHTLHPPRGYTSDNFSWNVYLKQCRAQPAPKPLFPKSNSPLCPSQFRVGMKLEAVDRKNSSLICVASVSDLIDNRLLIHFDSWGDVYDYWTDPSSPYIHPVGWCEENGYDLTPPNSFKNPSLFSWESYLKDTKAQPAPARAFKPRPPNAFKRGMKLEAIDKRAPFLLRPATIREVKDYQIKITFDGFPEEFGYWVDDDCPDIHPTGWGHKTGHPVTPPPLAEVKGECGTKGCVGEGNIRGGLLTKHSSAALCPYSPQNLNKETAPDRFCMNPDFYEVPEPINKTKNGKQEEKKVPDTTISSGKQDATEDSSCSESRIKTRNSSSSLVKEEIKEEITIKTEPEEKTEERIERRGRKRKLPEAEQRSEQLDKLRKELIQSVFDPGYNPGYKPTPEEQEVWVKHVATLGHKVNVTGGDPSSWNYKQVAAFVNTVIPSRAKLFLDQEIDGETFLMLSQNDLTKVLGLKLGPALKIFNCIILLRKKFMTL